MKEGKSQTSQVLKENRFNILPNRSVCIVQTQVYLTFFNYCYLANVMVLVLKSIKSEISNIKIPILHHQIELKRQYYYLKVKHFLRKCSRKKRT